MHMCWICSKCSFPFEHLIHYTRMLRLRYLHISLIVADMFTLREEVCVRFLGEIGNDEAALGGQFRFCSYVARDRLFTILVCRMIFTTTTTYMCGFDNTHILFSGKLFSNQHGNGQNRNLRVYTLYIYIYIYACVCVCFIEIRRDHQNLVRLLTLI